MPKAHLVAALAFFCIVLTVQAVEVPGTKYNHLRRVGDYYDPEGWFYMNWGVPDDDDTRIYFNITGVTDGWVGIGFNNPGQYMIKSDVLIGYFSDVFPTLIDYHAIGYSKPIVDDEQNFVLHSSKEENGITNFLFSRQLQTGDWQQDYRITNHSLQLLYAVGFAEELTYHRNRASVTINLITGDFYDYSRTAWSGPKVGDYHSDDFSFEWGFTEQDGELYIGMKIRAKTEGWFGIGFSPNQYMPQTDFIIMTVEDGDEQEDESRKGWATDRYVDDTHSQPKHDVQQDVIVLHSAQEDGYSYMSIARKVDTGDIQDRKVFDCDYLLWAMGETDSFNIHNKKGYVKVDWKDGDTEGGDTLPLIWIHGMLMIFAWMYIGVISTVLTRYCKSLQGAAWIYIHAILFIICVFISLCAFVIIIVEVSLTDRNHFDNYHKIAGLLIVFMSIVQPVVIGFFKLPGISDGIRKASAVVFMLALAQHRYFGHLMIVFGFVNIGTGLFLYTTHTGIWICFGVWLGLIAAYWAVHELFSVTKGFNEIIGKMGGAAPKNIFKDVFAFILFVIQVLFIFVCSAAFATILVLFAVYENDYAFNHDYGGIKNN